MGGYTPEQPERSVYDLARILANQVLERVTPGDRTVAKYAECMVRLQDARQTPAEYVRERILSPSAYRLYRAAALHQVATWVLEDLTALDAARRRRDQEMAKLLRERISVGYDYLQEVERDQDPIRCWSRGPTQSKKHALRDLPRGWIDQVGAQIRPRWREAYLVQACTGCRVEELVTGVDLTVTRRGTQPVLTARIYGAKCKEDGGGYYKGFSTGQEWREIDLDARSGPARELYELLRAAGAARGRVRLQGSKQGYGSAVKRAAVRALGPSHSDVSPYVLRHAATNALKAAGTPAEVAQALGHASEHTQRVYGYARRGSGGGCRPVGVRSATTPRCSAGSGPSPG